MSSRVPRIDVYVKGLDGTGETERISRSAGTRDGRVVKAIRVWMQEMKRDDRTDILRAFRDGAHTPNELYQAFKRGNLTTLLRMSGVGGTYADMYRWLETYSGAGEYHKGNMRNHYQQLEKLAPTASVQDLPAVLVRYREDCTQRNKLRMFEAVRNSVLAYLKDQSSIGDDHPLYAAARKVKPRKYISARSGNAPSLCEIQRLVQGMPQDIRHTIWSMVFTGIELGVYERGAYTNKGDHIHIAGTKAARGDNRRDREVPHFWSITPMARKKKALRGWLAKFSKLHRLKRTITPKDLRNAYARLLFEAGIPEVRCELYMGHAPKSLTRKYGRHPAKELWVPDAVKLREFTLSYLESCDDTDDNDVRPVLANQLLDTRMFLARGTLTPPEAP